MIEHPDFAAGLTDRQEQLRGGDPTNANAAYELAEMERKAGALESARKLFEQGVRHHPTFEQALVGLGRTLIALGRPEEALSHLNAAIAKNPDNHVAHNQLARAHRALGNTAAQEAALAGFKRARALASQRTGVVPQMRPEVTPQVLDLESPH